MILLIDNKGDEPVYRQIAGQIREQISTGKLAPGAGLPSVRSVASDLGVNLNTVARAYRQLESEGFVQIRGRSGARVTPPARSATRKSRRSLRTELRQLLSRMHQAGLSADELREWVERDVRRLAMREETR